jgi:hypothetical protein
MKTISRKKMAAFVNLLYRKGSTTVCEHNYTGYFLTYIQYKGKTYKIIADQHYTSVTKYGADFSAVYYRAA